MIINSEEILERIKEALATYSYEDLINYYTDRRFDEIVAELLQEVVDGAFKYHKEGKPIC